MNQIDQAFIQAYTTDDAYAEPAETLGVPAAVPSPTPKPHIQLYPDAQQSSFAEPIPAPHFPVQDLPPKAHADTATMQRAMREPLAEQTTVASTNERRPLSSFAAPTPAPTNTFDPVFEVDAFRWPSVTDDLLRSHAELLTPVAELLLTASEEGRSLVGIAGARPGVGCTTVHLCLARLLAASGKTVAIVDSNFAAANLAKNLGLEFDLGWEDVLTGKIPLAECVVRSNEDRMVLLPLNRSHATPVELLASIQTSVIAGVLRYHYDVVLYDLGAARNESQLAVTQQIVEQCRLDASIIVADTDAQHSQSDQQINALLNVLGSTCLGVIGNFTTTSS